MEYLPEKQKEGYVLEFDEDFNSANLDTSKWFPYYLPHWSSKKQSAARYEIRDGNLILKIAKDQEAWCPKLNGELKCSNFQTGIFSGKIGEKVGQHRFNKNCIVYEEQENRRLYTPQFGYFEIRAKARITNSNMVAFWMIGYEDQPEYSGEICIMEIFGNQIVEGYLMNGSGIHPYGDNSLKDEFYYDKLKHTIPFL